MQKGIEAVIEFELLHNVRLDVSGKSIVYFSITRLIIMMEKLAAMHFIYQENQAILTVRDGFSFNYIT